MQRQLETRMRIVDALERLMKSSAIDRIKVTDLCKEADVGRTTFYDYFENVYAVATWTYERLLQESLYMIEGGCSFEEAHVRLFENLRSHRDFFTKAFRSQDYNSVYGYGNRSIAQYYIDIIPKKTGKPLTDDEILQVRLFTAGAAFLTTEWACDGMRTEPQAMAHAFALSAPAPFDCVNPRR